MTHVCRQCSADASITRFGHLEGEDGGVQVAIEGLTAYDCANGHKRFLTPDFPMKFIESLMTSDELITPPPAVEKGFFRKHQHCPECGQELPDEATSTASAHADLTVPDADPIGVDVKMPLYVCPGCNREVTLTQSGVERGIMQAVANAFRSANIPPG